MIEMYSFPLNKLDLLTSECSILLLIYKKARGGVWDVKDI